MKAEHLRLVDLLPHEAAVALQQAVLTPIARTDPLARVKALEKVTEQIKSQYPQFFRKETP